MILVHLHDSPSTIRSFAKRNDVCILGSNETIFNTRKRTASVRDDPMEMREVRYRPRDGQIHESTGCLKI